MSKKRRMPNRTDAGNAEWFARLYKERVRYDHLQKRWLIWNLKRRRWQQDSQGQVRRLQTRAARHRLRAAASISDKDEKQCEVSWAMQSENKNRIDSALSLAQGEPPISDSGLGWDSEPWLLGVANGIVNLRTGELREGRPEDHISRYSAIRFDPEARSPRFEQFIREIFADDCQLIAFMARAIGYTLTGLTNEQCLFCCYGSGANGKSTLFRVLHVIFGDYASNLPFTAFESKGRSNIPNDLTMLVGRRFVTASETREGVRLNEQRIKALTGEDPITARRLYHEHFTFDPTFKLWLAFNHKPVIADDSEGMWRRIKLVPFTQEFQGDMKDDRLFDKLKAEAPGILAWAVRACAEWQRQGLGAADAVVSATASYRDESDHVSQFLDECCTIKADASVPVRALRSTYEQWTDENQETPLSLRAFADRLKQRGVQQGERGHSNTRVWLGLSIKGECEHASACERVFT